MDGRAAPATAAVAAVLPALVVVLAGSGHPSGRPDEVLFAIVVFAVSWVPAGFVLATSRAPAAGGVLAGAYVAAVVLWMVRGLGNEPSFVLFVWTPFAALSVALGAASGGAAAVIMGSSEQTTVTAAALAVPGTILAAFLAGLQPPGWWGLVWLIPLGCVAGAAVFLALGARKRGD